MTKFFLLSLLFFLSPVFSSAQKTDRFIQYISEKIYNDCKGIEIRIRNDSPLSFIQNSTKSFSFCGDNCVMKWPYSYDDVHTLIAMAVSREPYTSYSLINGSWELNDDTKQEYEFKNSQNETVKKISRDGRNVLSCGTKILDISRGTYWWNRKIVDMPTVENFLTKNLSISIPIVQITGIGIVIGIPVTLIFRKEVKKTIQKIWQFFQ